MTKEEILKAAVARFNGVDVSNIHFGNTKSEEAVLSAMDEYTKQQAIAFSNWQEEGCYLYNTNPNGWCRLNENFETEDVCETTEQLYDQFIESQNK